MVSPVYNIAVKTFNSSFLSEFSINSLKSKYKFLKMPQASEIAWLIPVFPLIGAVLSGLGLIINNKINNSREIVSIGLISSLVFLQLLVIKLIEQINGYQPVENYLYGLMLEILQFQWACS